MWIGLYRSENPNYEVIASRGGNITKVDKWRFTRYISILLQSIFGSVRFEKIYVFGLGSAISLRNLRNVCNYEIASMQMYQTLFAGTAILHQAYITRVQCFTIYLYKITLESIVV